MRDDIGYQMALLQQGIVKHRKNAAQALKKGDFTLMTTELSYMRGYKTNLERYQSEINGSARRLHV